MRVLLVPGEIASYFFLIFATFRQGFRSKTATFRQGADSVQETWKFESCDRACVRSDDVRVEKMGRGIEKTEAANDDSNVCSLRSWGSASFSEP